MIVISTRDFRSNQTYYLNLARNGENVVLKSRSMGSFKLTPVKERKPRKGRDITNELVAALQQVKDYMDGKIDLPTLDSVIDEL